MSKAKLTRHRKAVLELFESSDLPPRVALGKKVLWLFVATRANPMRISALTAVSWEELFAVGTRTVDGRRRICTTASRRFQ